MAGRRALVLGSTGMVGRHLVSYLLEDGGWGELTLIVRRDPGFDDPRVQVLVTSLDEMSRHAAAFKVDDVFCCLGTTIRQAGSREAFRKVDHDYCVVAATLARQGGAQRFLMISAVNADVRGLSFYARVKGETERDVQEVGLPAVVFMQPSLLEGERSEKRPAERAGVLTLGLVKPLLGWTGADWLPVHGADVARAMVAAAKVVPPPVLSRLRYRQIRQYAEDQKRTRGET